MIHMKQNKIINAIIIILCVSIISLGINYFIHTRNSGQQAIAEKETEEKQNETKKNYIKWVDFNIPYKVLDKTLKLDISSQSSPVKLNWIDLLAYLSAKYGGNYKSYKTKDLDNLVARLNGGEKIEEITKGMKYFSYYSQAYNAILKEFVGSYDIQVKNDNGEVEWQTKYGLKAFLPIAQGYNFSHYDDFGDSRSYGYKRVHFGNDLMGSTGTPIIAVESGYVEVLGWNIYGGWRIGIRSFDGKRYYYYAHLRKGHPYNNNLIEGGVVNAGDVIGYLGMTGYSTKEDSNNIKVPHLHFGLQLIFDKSQKDGPNQVWIDVYNLIELLKKNKSVVIKSSDEKEFDRAYNYYDANVPD